MASICLGVNVLTNAGLLLIERLYVSTKFEDNILHLSCKKTISKCRLSYVGNFVWASVC